MFRRYRHRRGPYAVAAPSTVVPTIRKIIVLLILLFLVWTVGKWFVGLFLGGNSVQARAASMDIVGTGRVNVSFDGGLAQPAASSLKLHPGDKVSTASNAEARLEFFDGSVARIDALTELLLKESEEGSAASMLSLDLSKGALWIKVPAQDSFSGSITRTLVTPRFTLTFPSDTEAVVEQNALLVFDADGNGVSMDIRGTEAPVFIGEGQQILLPEGGEVTGNALRFRSAIDPLAVQRDFIARARTDLAQAESTGTGATAAGDESLLVIQKPADGLKVMGNTVRVEGTVSSRVDRVRVNGYLAAIDRTEGSFSQDLTLRDEGDTSIRVEALDARGLTLTSVSRTVKRTTMGTTGETSPVAITSPARAGETYRTQQRKFVIRGTVPAGTDGVMVNDYKLQLFRPGDTTWSYLANADLGNLAEGVNLFDVYALNAEGMKSAPAHITILLEEGTEGVVTGGASSTSSAAAIIDETQLPKNDPLMPGTLAVTGPAAGTQFTATGSEFLLEGTTPKSTASVWVNGYKLQLYTPGKTFWNYIAKVEFKTLKVGTNVYKIVARNAKDEILDVLEYTVTYNP